MSPALADPGSPSTVIARLLLRARTFFRCWPVGGSTSSSPFFRPPHFSVITSPFFRPPCRSMARAPASKSCARITSLSSRFRPSATSGSYHLPPLQVHGEGACVEELRTNYIIIFAIQAFSNVWELYGAAMTSKLKNKLTKDKDEDADFLQRVPKKQRQSLVSTMSEFLYSEPGESVLEGASSSRSLNFFPNNLNVPEPRGGTRRTEEDFAGKTSSPFGVGGGFGAGDAATLKRLDHSDDGVVSRKNHSEDITTSAMNTKTGGGAGATAAGASSSSTLGGGSAGATSTEDEDHAPSLCPSVPTTAAAQPSKSYWRSARGLLDDIFEKPAYGDHELDGTFDDWVEIVVLFGQVTLFAVVFPLTPLLASILALVEIRIDSYKIFKFLRRPTPRRCVGIGSWLHLLEMVSLAALLTNSMLLIWTFQINPLFGGESSDWSSFCALILSLGFFKYCIEFFVPVVPRNIKTLTARHKLLVDTFLQKYEQNLNSCGGSMAGSIAGGGSMAGAESVAGSCGPGGPPEAVGGDGLSGPYKAFLQRLDKMASGAGGERGEHFGGGQSGHSSSGRPKMSPKQILRALNAAAVSEVPFVDLESEPIPADDPAQLVHIAHFGYEPGDLLT